MTREELYQLRLHLRSALTLLKLCFKGTDEDTHNAICGVHGNVTVALGLVEDELWRIEYDEQE